MAWINLPKKGPDSWQGVRVALRCMCVMALTAGSTRSSGVLYVGIMHRFGASREEASWPVSLAGAMLSLTGAVSGPLAQAFSPKPVILCGSILIVVGLIASVFAPSVPWLTFTYGFVFGSGLGTVYTINVIFLQQYFVKMRGLALGVNYAGSTTAGFVFPVFITLLLGEYGFRGALLILSGVFMHIFVLCLTHKEAPWLRAKVNMPRGRERMEAKGTPNSHGKVVLVEDSQATDAQLSDEMQAGVSRGVAKRREEEREAPEASAKTVEGPKGVSTMSELREYAVSDKAQKPDDGEGDVSAQKVSLLASLSILKIPEFLVIIFTFVLFFYCYDAYFTTIIDYIVDQNIPMIKATTVVPLYSVTDMVARLLIPQLADRGFINKMLLQCLSYGLLSACFFLMPIAAETGDFLWIAALAMVQSTGIGTSIVMYGVLMAELVGISRLPMAYGIVGLFVGSTYATKPYFIGYFRDTIGDYSPMYVVCGTLMAVASLGWLITWYVHRISKRRRTSLNTLNGVAETAPAGTDPMNSASRVNDEAISIGNRSRADSAICHL